MNSESKNLLSLSNDLRDLYCRTKNSKIENLFIRVAQENDDQFIKWLSSNKKIKSQLDNPEVLETLVVLSSLRKKYPSQPTIENPSPALFGKEDVVKSVWDQSISRRTPHILAFSSLINDRRVSSILEPFKDIILKYAETLSTTRNPVNPSDIINDLLKIEEAYRRDIEDKIDRPYDDFAGLDAVRPKKETRQQKKFKLFTYLFRRFSEEIYGAANRAGNPFLANKIKGEGVLADPVSLAQILKGQSIPYQMLKEAERLAKTVLKNLDENRHEFNYEAIKMGVMMFAGTMSSDQLMNFYNQKRKEESKELVSLLSDEDKDEAEAEESPIASLPVQDKQWINPRALQMISAVLYFLYRASKTP